MALHVSHGALCAFLIAVSVPFEGPEAGTTPTAPKQPAVPAPAVGVELSKVKGVSLVCEKNMRAAQWGATATGFRYSSEGRTLDEILVELAQLQKDLIIGASMLPGGVYTVKIDVRPDRDRATKMFLQAVEQAFNLKLSLQKRKMKVLVMTKGKNWKKDGFAEAKRDGENSNGDRTDAAQVRTITFHGLTMDFVRDRVERLLNRFVLDETGLKGYYDGSIEIQPTREKGGARWQLPPLRDALAQRGLLLQELEREVKVIVVEQNQAAARPGR